MQLAACSFLIDPETLSGGANADIDAGAFSDSRALEAASAPDARVAVDAGLPPADAATESATTDARTADDASVRVDAAIDAYVDAGSQVVTSPCTGTNPKSLFCDDFDTGGDDLSKAPLWQASNYESGAGPGSFDRTRALSAPRSARFDITPDPAARGSRIYKRVTPVNKAIQIDLDFESVSGAIGAAAEVNVASFGMYPYPAGLTYHEVAIKMLPTGMYLAYFRTMPPSTVIVPIGAAMTKWTHLSLTISFRTSPATAILSVDGKVAGSHNLVGTQFDFLFLSLGPTFADNQTVPLSLNYDNVIVQAP
jgi:hypothetical protein